MNCNVIKDLMPLVIDACCSPESAKLTEEHLKICPDCRKAYEAMQKPCVRPTAQGQPKKLHRISDWKASALQSLMLFLSFAVLSLGVILEGGTPAGPGNGLWAGALIVPAAGYLLSLGNWFFIRVYKSRKVFSTCSCLTTLTLTGLGYVWAILHYAGHAAPDSPRIWLGALLSAVFCVLSKVLSNRYALMLGRE